MDVTKVASEEAIMDADLSKNDSASKGQEIACSILDGVKEPVNCWLKK